MVSAPIVLDNAHVTTTKNVAAPPITAVATPENTMDVLRKTTTMSAEDHQKTTTTDLHPQRDATTANPHPHRDVTEVIAVIIAVLIAVMMATKREEVTRPPPPTAFQLIRPSRTSNSVMSFATRRPSRRDTARLQITES